MGRTKVGLERYFGPRFDDIEIVRLGGIQAIFGRRFKPCFGRDSSRFQKGFRLQFGKV